MLCKPTTVTLPPGQRPLLNWKWNTLIDGCIIDINGVYILYQSPIKLAKSLPLVPAKVLSEINALQPTCPVLFQRLLFTASNVTRRYENAMHALEHSYRSYISNHSRIYESYDHISNENTGAVTDTYRPMIFTACGHVHGYCSRLQDAGKCPLCREVGPLVPLVFPFCSSIDTGRPTHVFNPCGHAASLEAITYWAETGPSFGNISRSATTVPVQAHSNNPGNLHVDVDHNTSNNTHSRSSTHATSDAAIDYSSRRHVTLEGQRRVHICPFCTAHLSRNKPYSKIILQQARGDNWSEVEEEEQELRQAFAKGDNWSEVEEEKQELRQAFAKGGNLNSFFLQQTKSYPLVSNNQCER